MPNIPANLPGTDFRYFSQVQIAPQCCLMTGPHRIIVKEKGQGGRLLSETSQSSWLGDQPMPVNAVSVAAKGVSQ